MTNRLFMIACILTLIGASVCHAEQVTLAWDANDPTPEGYRLYQRIEGQPYNYDQPIWTGTDIIATVENLAEGITYFFVVRAFVGDDESGDSNEVSYTPPDSDSPQNLAVQDQLDRIEEKIDQIMDALGLNAQPAPETAYCGNADSKIFHKASHWCGTGAVHFETRQAAIDAGYRPCGICKP